LERLLSRATLRSWDVLGADATLFKLFKLPISTAKELPVAAVTWLADGGEPGEAWWLRADPVNLHADLWQVLLVDARNLAISPVEAESLVAEFNKTFAPDGWHLEAPHPSRWYLRLTADPGLRTYPLQEAIGRDIHPLLPIGPQRQRWHTLLTEIQMLFHSAKINSEREARGSPLINSVWFWGGGFLPEAAQSPAQGIYADDPVTRGLAHLAKVAVNPLPAKVTDWRLASEGENEALVVMETTRFDRIDNDSHGWVIHVNELERDWFCGCLDMLKAKRLHYLYLYPCNGQCYQITANYLKRFWRPSRPLVNFCED
jgi:hypothetical protein